MYLHTYYVSNGAINSPYDLRRYHNWRAINSVYGSYGMTPFFMSGYTHSDRIETDRTILGKKT